MAIYIGGTEISSLFSGGTQIQKVYSGTDEIWSNSYVMAANGARHTAVNNQIGVATSNQGFVWTGWSIVPDGNVATVSTLWGTEDNNDNVQLDSNAGNPRLRVKIQGQNGNSTDVFVGMTEGEPFQYTATKIEDAEEITWQCTQGAITNSEVLPAAGIGSIGVQSLYGTSTGGSSNPAIYPAWDLVFTNTSSGIEYTIPMNEGTGTTSLEYEDGIADEDYTWNSADWIPRPT
jgi:hypothetical protein